MSLALEIAEAIGRLIAAVAEVAGKETDELRAEVIAALHQQGDETDQVAEEIDGSLP